MIYLIPTDTCFWIACSINETKSYEKIYKIKKRNYEKALAIMVYDFNWLKENTSLTKKQINFLKNYKKPFTVLTNSNSISLWLNYENENGIWFQNRNIYKKIALRVAHNDSQKKLIKKLWPIFLTSANNSWKKEIYDINKLKETFSYYLDKKIVKILNWKIWRNKTSNIFEFIWDNLDLKYLRKN